MTEHSYSERMEIELLKKDVTIISTLCEKFDVTISKMQEIATSLSRMVSLQEQRLENQENTTREMQSVLEMRRIEHNNDIKELHGRITNINHDLSEKIEDTEKTILSEIKSLKEELTKNKEKEADADKTLGSRITAIEAWKYMMAGAIMVIIWILAKAELGPFVKTIFK